ncbi:MAG: carbohydrate ABC transporter permease [Defluviitaleaceae bacterium]|nr:carbohydrate ABC transporter permease [Defluviitaleaceae bacterium]
MQFTKNLLEKLPSFRRGYVLRAKKAVKETIMSIFIFIILIGIAFVILSPLLAIVSNSLMSRGDIYNPLVYLIPRNPASVHYEFALHYMNYWQALRFTLGYTFGITALQIAVCSLVGYGFARFRFPGRNILFGMVILTIVVPTQTIIIPLYSQFRFFDLFGALGLFMEPINLLGRVWSTVILTTTGQGLRAGLFIFIFRQFFRGLPKELEEAAVIDGAGPVYTYGRVMLPNAVPAIITVMLFSIVWQYNDVYFAGVFMSGVRNLLPVNLSGLATAYHWGEQEMDFNLVNAVVNAGVVLTIIPIIVIYMFLQKFFMEGIERSGIVG